jgi:hypothetical protein
MGHWPACSRSVAITLLIQSLEGDSRTDDAIRDGTLADGQSAIESRWRARSRACGTFAFRRILSRAMRSNQQTTSLRYISVLRLAVTA